MDERAQVLRLVQRHGWNATAFQTLEPGYAYFFHGPGACVAYVDTGGAWVAAGAPIAAPEALRATAMAFAAAARRAGRRCCFFAVEGRVHTASDEFRALQIGEQPAWDPRAWPEVLARQKSLREQLRRARAKHVAVRKATLAELESGATHHAMRALLGRWLASRRMEVMRFLVRVEPFTFIDQRSYFLAELDGQLVGFAVCAPVPARHGWFLENLVRDPDAPNGTAELLVDAAMRWAAHNGASWFTLGLAPLAGELHGLLCWVRRRARFLYNFEGLHAYKAKLRPSSWAPIYLAFPRGQSALTALWDALTAFAGTNLVWFGLRSLLRKPALALHPLAWLLVPWTTLLALAPAEHWFSASWVKWSWVAFDVCFAAALFWLLRRPRLGLARTLAVAVTADALLTTTQAALWNVQRARGPLEWALLLLACAAPAVASVLLWSATRGLARTRRTRAASVRPSVPSVPHATPRAPVRHEQ